MPIDLTTVVVPYEKERIRQQQRITLRVDNLIEQLLSEITPLAITQTLPKGVFSLAKMNILNSRVNAALETFKGKLLVEVQNGIKDAWELSNRKLNKIVDARLDKSLIPENIKVTFYNANAPALDAFIKREVNGLNLSDRVYKIGERLRAELEAALGAELSEGIGVGLDAASLGRKLKGYLNNPDALFRRVRDAKGKLQLSKRAKAFHPGQGVYRSATRNINRLTVTETNMANRSADMARYAQTPFILGFEVRLSAQHPKYDICDNLKGKYPVGFVFVGWHPFCLCICVPILMSDEQFLQYQQLVLAGTDSPAAVFKLADRVMTIPSGASKWIDDNAKRVSGYANLPLWWQQNPKFVPKVAS